jgi:O-antigen/teichoic acid export membrane protein
MGTTWALPNPRRLISGAHVLALADQAVVSAASFVTTVIIGRYADASELGAYAIAISVLASLYTTQGSLITLPFSIQRHRPVGTPSEFAGSSLLQGVLLSSVAAGLLAVIGLGLRVGGAPSEAIAMTWALAAVTQCALLREFARRFAFTHLRVAHALALDGAVCAMQLAMIGALAWSGRMSALTALGALGLASGLAGLGWLYFARAEFAVHLAGLRDAVKLGWGLGRWLFVKQAITQVQDFITYWLSAAIAGAAVTGVFAACMSVVAFSNPVIFGLSNILAPRSVEAWRAGGGASLRRQAIRDVLLIVAVLIPFCVMVLLFGDDVMRLLYRSKEFVAPGATLGILALAAMAFAIGLPAGNALAAMERPRAIVVAASIGTVLTVGLVWWLLHARGLPGAAVGMLVGNVVGSLGLWGGFLTLVSRPRDSASAPWMPRPLARTTDPACN